MERLNLSPKGVALRLKQKFELMASSKANYYTKGSPIQFVQLDLLREVSSGEVAVCFNFKNVSQEPLQNLNIRFKCKDTQGEVVCDSTFCYEGVVAEPGEVFGGTEAVYLSQDPLSSIDVRLVSAERIEGEEVSLIEYHRVRLPEQKELEPEICRALQQNTGNEQLRYEPAVLQGGWQCACGAFHPGNEEGVYCDECGADRILVQNMITSLRCEQNGESLSPTIDEEPTQMVLGKSMRFERSEQVDMQATQVVPSVSEAMQPEKEQPVQTNYRSYDEAYDADDEQDELDYDDFQEREERARMLIRWLPVLTALLCLMVIAGGALWYQTL